MGDKYKKTASLVVLSIFLQMFGLINVELYGQNEELYLVETKGVMRPIIIFHIRNINCL